MQRGRRWPGRRISGHHDGKRRMDSWRDLSLERGKWSREIERRVRRDKPRREGIYRHKRTRKSTKESRIFNRGIRIGRGDLTGANRGNRGDWQTVQKFPFYAS